MRKDHKQANRLQAEVGGRARTYRNRKNTVGGTPLIQEAERIIGAVVGIPPARHPLPWLAYLMGALTGFAVCLPFLITR